MKNLSIADLKALYDFCCDELNDASAIWEFEDKEEFKKPAGDRADYWRQKAENIHEELSLRIEQLKIGNEHL
jgi:hypothetical protein